MRALLVVAMLVLGGCGVHVGADPARMSLRPVYPPERAWPALAEPTGVHAATVDWVVRDAADGRELLRRPVYAIERSEQVGACTVRELRRIGARGARARAMLIDVEAAVEGHPAKGFIGRLREHRETPFPVARTPTSVEAGLVQGVSLRELDRPSRYGPVVEHMVADRAFEFQPPLSGPARGLILHLRAFADNPFESSVIDEFRRRGWAVLSGRFATSLSFVGRYDVRGEEDFAAVGAEIARDVDRVCAERAYAFEAALNYLAARHPEVPQRPGAIVGFSAGSLGVPTVAARLAGRLDAGVIICGGADLLSIAQRNPLARIGLRVTMNGGVLTEAGLARLSAEYLAASALDPFATAPAMAAMPVLLIHAREDREVPADTGDLLYERLGRPERWEYDGGHSWVFLILPRLKGEIARWLEGAAGAAPAE